ncbi:MAG: 50S ribosomal protein L29 [Methanobacteriota archaeon]|jgi:large subunit ribosomal protein L29|nr:MAG: 50S ribosomal protein L29 [Euryarchaeota archaeon]
MAIFRAKEVHQMNDVELEEQLSKLQLELVQKYGKVSTGGASENPGRIRELRRTIARIHTEKRMRPESREVRSR